MPAAGEWTIEISPKTRTGSAVSEQFGDNFEGCLARAKSLREERSASHHIYVHAPAGATVSQRQQVREAGFERPGEDIT